MLLSIIYREYTPDLRALLARTYGASRPHAYGGRRGYKILSTVLFECLTSLCHFIRNSLWSNSASDAMRLVIIINNNLLYIIIFIIIYILLFSK